MQTKKSKLLSKVKNALMIGVCLTVMVSCSKQLASQNFEKEVPKQTLQYMSESNKKKLLDQISNDTLFIDYINALIEFEKYHRALLVKSKSYDPAKFRRLPKATAEIEIVNKLQSSGFEDSARLIEKIKSVNQKWIYISMRFPDFTKSFTDEEKKIFFRKNIDYILDKSNENQL